MFIKGEIMGYLKYISDTQIDAFVKTICCPHARNIIVPNSNDRNYVNVFTNLLDTTLHITDFECINKFPAWLVGARMCHYLLL